MSRIILIAVMILDLVLPFVIAVPYRHYSHTKMVMSVLGGKDSPWGTVYNIWMILSGIAFTILAGTLFSSYREKQFGLALTLFILVALYGVGDEVVSGFFPLNGPEPDDTIQYKIHGAGSAVGFTALQFAPLILAITAFRSQQPLIGWRSAAFFVLSLAAFVFFVLGEKPRFQNTAFAMTGLWQRVLCLLMYAPFLVWLAVQ